MQDENKNEEDEFQVEVEYADDAIKDSEVEPDVITDESNGTTKLSVVNFTGLLREKGSRAPIADVTVYLKDTEYEAETDASGKFEFRDLPPKKYTVVIPTINYEKVETEEEIREGERTEVKYYLEPIVYGGLEVVVRGKKVKKEVSRTTIKIKEATVLPGSGGDPAKVIESMPGVARGGGGGNEGLVVRGSNAQDSRIYIDGHWVPMLFHFGGVKSVYNGRLLDEFEITTGGFTAENGLATGGVVNLKSKDPRKDRWGGYVDLSTIDVSTAVEGPINEDVGLALGVRRSTLDLIMGAMDLNSKIDGMSFDTYPAYYDYQGKLHWQIDDHNSVSLSIYGLYDKMAIDQQSVDEKDPMLTGESSWVLQSHNAAIKYHYEDDFIESDLSAAYVSWHSREQFGQYSMDFDWDSADIREDLRFKLAKTNTLAIGAQFNPGRFILKTNMVRPPKEGDNAFTFSNSEAIEADTKAAVIGTGAYIQDEIEVGPVKIIPGVRFDHLSNIKAIGVGPRGSVRWQVIEPLALKVAGGLYHRMPDPDEYVEPFGNTDLEFERAVHAVAGVEWAITDVINIDVQGYYKYLDKLVSHVPEPTSERIYENGGKGYVYGGEIMLRHNWTDKFFGWVSYSISRSMRNDGPGTEYRLFDQDQTHNVVAVASWQFYKGWRLGSRFQLTSGEPVTKFKSSVLNADNGTYVPVYGSEDNNAVRRPLYHRLDIRLDKAWLFDSWVLHTYAEVQNVYNRTNPVYKVNNYDFTEIEYETDIPIMPSIGITAEF
ncbi:MAG: TonB-dependent receptor [Proteobacteria bacterium]|nr:TonB-dependent receptor [Pseudomonadota bacterium]